MKVKVISVFRDKFTGKYYTPGEVIEVSEESRVLDMESRRLAERVEAKTTEVKAPEEKKEVNKSRKTKRDGCEKRNAFFLKKTKCASNLIRKAAVHLQNQSKTPSLYIKINGVQMDF